MPLDYPVLRGVETLAVGSAKVPRLPCLADVVEAPDVPAAAAALAANAALLDGYAAALETEGLASMAATLRRVLGRTSRLERMNADLASVLTWLLNAQHKTAGRATMTFAPWAVVPGGDAPACLDRGAAGRARVAVAESTHALMAAANRWVYERVIGLLNASAPRGAACESVLDRLVSPAGDPAGDLRPRFVEPADVKTLLKIDYKLDGGGRLVIVDVNSGLIGAWFDDLLLDDARDLAPAQPRITPRLVTAVLERHRLEHGGPPRRVALCVLDEQMYRQWVDADIAGLNAELLHQLGRAGSAQEDIAVVDATELGALARPEGPRRLFAGTWRGTPDLVVFYSGRIGSQAEPAALAALRDAGVTLVDSARHGLAASKELVTPESLGGGLPDGVRLPETFLLGGAGDGAWAAAAVAQVWDAAAERGWRLLAVKLDKQRRSGAPGDYPSAYLYPVTPLGKELAERQVARAVDHVMIASPRASRLVVTRIDHLGGCGGPLGRRDIEMRTYAFPVLPG